MCKYGRQRLHLKLYLYQVAKYSLIPYIYSHEHEKDYLIISVLPGTVCPDDFLCTCQEGLSDY